MATFSPGPLQQPVVSDSGEAALFFDSGVMPDHTLQARIRELALLASDMEGVTQTRPGVGNLMICFDPERTERRTLQPLLRQAWEQTKGHVQPGRLIEVPVEYGGESGPDLEHVSEILGLSPDEVIALHLSATYTAATVGALPGFPYLMGLNPKLSLGRRDSPRLSVPAGSVVIAGGMCGIITRQSASGWHIIGRTSLNLFDLEQTPPNAIEPGDDIRFHRVMGQGC